MDKEDEHLLAQHQWTPRRFGKYWYAIASADGKNLFMHRVIAGAAPGQVVDHINRNGLDNRRANLRLATHSQNHANAPRRADNRSGVKGVSWVKSRRRWVARIHVDKKQMPLGYYRDSMDAAAAYDAAALKHFGEFALTNEALGLTSDAGGTF